LNICIAELEALEFFVALAEKILLNDLLNQIHVRDADISPEG